MHCAGWACLQAMKRKRGQEHHAAELNCVKTADSLKFCGKIGQRGDSLRCCAQPGYSHEVVFKRQSEYVAAFRPVSAKCIIEGEL